MKKVILYGIRGTGRKEIEHFLSDSYEIVGYSDSDVQYCDYNYFNYIRFFLPEELKNQFFDYLIITPKDLKVSDEIKDKLVQGG